MKIIRNRDLSTRAINVLALNDDVEGLCVWRREQNAYDLDIDRLCTMTRADLRALVNCGVVTLSEIEGFLRRHGRRLMVAIEDREV